MYASRVERHSKLLPRATRTISDPCARSMPIMQSCCCWRSVRRGSFACAVYTGIYFALTAVMTGAVLKEEYQYLTGNRSLPQSSSILEPETISPTTVWFNLTLLTCSCCGVLCSILLLYGLFKDQRVLLVPWILTVISFSVIDVTYSLYLFIVSFNFNPITAMLFTLDFFLLCLNMYSLLCVISQYQEYMAGRGTAADDCDYRIPAVRYAVQPTTTATSCLSSRRVATNNETRATATATPTQSPTAVQTAIVSEKSPIGPGKPTRKHVQFPDTANPNQGEKPVSAPDQTAPRWNSQETEVCKLPRQLVSDTVDDTSLLSPTTTNRSSPTKTDGSNLQT